MVFIRNLDLKSGSMKRGGRGLMQKKKIFRCCRFFIRKFVAQFKKRLDLKGRDFTLPKLATKFVAQKLSLPHVSPNLGIKKRVEILRNQGRENSIKIKEK